MDRRRALLIVAAVVALLGTALVYLYVRGADSRAEARFDAVDVLRVVAPIEPGEKVEDAQAAGKIALQPVARDALVPGYLTSTESITGQVAVSALFPGEQLIPGQFTTETGEVQSALAIPKGQIAISINLTDPARVAGFVEPGSHVAVFLSQGATFTRLLLPDVEVIAVGSTTVTKTTTTTAEGDQTVEQLPRTLLTVALDQKDAEKVLYASNNGELQLGLRTNDSNVRASQGMTNNGLFR